MQRPSLSSSPSPTGAQEPLTPPSLPVLLLKQFVCGLRDALRFDKMITVLKRSDTAFSRFWDIMVFNAGFQIGVMAVFQFGLLPLIQQLFASGTHSVGALRWISTASELVLSYAIYPLWVVPLFALGFVINPPWLQVFCTRAFILILKQQPPAAALKSMAELPKQIAAEVFTTTFYVMFLLQALIQQSIPSAIDDYLPFEISEDSIFAFVPRMGPVLNFVFLCWLYALYCFEYKWPHWHINRRLKYIEDNWAYFWAFGMVVGLPFTMCQVYFGLFWAYALWWILFPWFIVAAIAAPEPPCSVACREGGRPTLRLFRLAKFVNKIALNVLVWLLRLFSGVAS
eukprot:TRINITY_DN11662_c0_g1_i1.p2 TRINITY_DN11662_c0_g1~~TRINITY_DN11662_c0_g1_i1.p2  ORF type:complete len:341 (-),score=79.01 TRINITY_DN11662_c0_g1_i1:1394-2416(-)